MGNEKWMAVHSLLIFLLFGSQTYAILSKQEIGFKIVIAINCVIILLMAYIMDKVNRPQYTVWANRKFVGRNTQEVSEYIGNSTVNEREIECLNQSTRSANELDDEVKAVEVDSQSIFEE